MAGKAEQPHDPAVSVWLAPPRPPRRGSAPTGLSREKITAATLELLDAEGLPAFSMRRLAAELEVTAMSVYWYVDNKDQLLELALDAAFADLAVPPLEDHGDWRRHVYVMAHQYRQCFLRHPWATELIGRFLAIGPNAMLMSNSAVGALARAGLSGDALGGAIALIFQYTYGFALSEVQWGRRVKLAGAGPEELYRQMMGVLTASDSRHAEWEKLLGHDREEKLEAAGNRQFDAGLEMAMAGIEAAIAALPPQP
ncbi:TetR family transcriptional regulator [Streptomyces tateyamensis]|uniref:TetR family transcriptional regulator n=1 Tax=Streptomyces tateyamensis TaxID=565073 RepID=A0A2V4N429_9ACTN|nr:TetR/AcrR family transcriptional regulator [Streptomyces tateyamensis]PYC74552.1 TetR family transcriptional regulator [Streptomyces tateyamensis]